MSRHRPSWNGMNYFMSYPKGPFQRNEKVLVFIEGEEAKTGIEELAEPVPALFKTRLLVGGEHKFEVELEDGERIVVPQGLVKRV